MADEKMLIEADSLSSKYGKIKLTLTDGRVFIGVSWGIQPITDDETGEELDENCIALKLANGGYEEFKNNEIKSVEGLKDAN